MKINKNVLVSLGLFVLVASIYRILPNRAPGFAPQIAMALFGGAFFMKNKKWAFILPLFSMFLSDALYQVLYINHLSPFEGFYEGQWINYILIASTAVFGFGTISDFLSDGSALINFLVRTSSVPPSLKIKLKFEGIEPFFDSYVFICLVYA